MRPTRPKKAGGLAWQGVGELVRALYPLVSDDERGRMAAQVVNNLLAVPTSPDSPPLSADAMSVVESLSRSPDRLGAEILRCASRYSHGLGFNALMRGDFTQAKHHLEAAARLDDQRAVTFAQLANVCEQLGHHADATRHARRAIQLEPEVSAFLVDPLRRRL